MPCQKICAVKVSHDIPASLNEALVLERLSSSSHPSTHPSDPHPSDSIIRSFGLKSPEHCDWIQSTRDRDQPFKHLNPQATPLGHHPSLILALEYCPAGDLFQFVRSALSQRSQPPHSSFDPTLKPHSVTRPRWSRWSLEIAQALAWCKERHVIVGDLKPHNILLTHQLSIKLSDFNSSILLPDDSSNPDSEFIDPQGTGTSVYAAPELVRPPPSPCSFPVDVFSFGITIYFLITGREPYRGIQSTVERMLLISRGAFWEHELAVRWRLLEQSDLGRSFSRTHPRSHLPGVSTRHPSPLPSSSTIESLLGYKPEQIEVDRHHPTLESEENYRADCHDDTPSSLYADGTPKIKFLDGDDIVDERIMRLIARMCSPIATDRPQIEEIIQELRSI